MAQLRMAATSQQLYYVDQNAYAANATDLQAYGFRQGEQVVMVVAADASTYCMQAPGGGGTFMIIQDTDTSLGLTRKTLSLPGLQVATGSAPARGTEVTMSQGLALRESSILSSPKRGRACSVRQPYQFLLAAGVQPRNVLQPVLQPG